MRPARLVLAPLLLLAPLSLAACGDKDEDTGTGGPADTAADTDTDTDGGTADACDDLDPDTCATRADCVVITSRPVLTVGELECIDWGADPVPVGCMEAGMGCDDAVYLATGPGEPEGSCDWWFSSGCIPDGYTVCESAEPEACPE